MTDIIRLENQNETTREFLLTWQKEYMEAQMPDVLFHKMIAEIEKAKRENRHARSRTYLLRAAAVLVAAVLLLVALPNTSANIAYAMGQIPVIGNLVKVVTFREYSYSDGRNEADVEVPELQIGENADRGVYKETLIKTTEEINAEIGEITDALLEEFKLHMQNDLGYKDLEVRSEVITSTEDYFTLKLSCYEAMASGYEWNYFYTIDLQSGERIMLKDLFVEDSDYQDRISSNIKEQMRRQMKEDENKTYWIDSEWPEMDFGSITEDTSFYLDGDGHVVISFNEGDVAPMYMGVCEFVIPEEVLEDIRK